MGRFPDGALDLVELFYPRPARVLGDVGKTLGQALIAGDLTLWSPFRIDEVRLALDFCQRGVLS